VTEETAFVITEWVEGDENGQWVRDHRVFMDHKGHGETLVVGDDTEQEFPLEKEFPDPNLVVVKVTTTGNVLAAIEADTSCFVISSPRKSPKGVPDAAEFGQLRSFLTGKGVSPEWVNSVLPSPSTKTREENHGQLRASIKILPKKQIAAS
jgi:hypothetical protein